MCVFYSKVSKSEPFLVYAKSRYNAAITTTVLCLGE